MTKTQLSFENRIDEFDPQSRVKTDGFEPLSKDFASGDFESLKEDRAPAKLDTPQVHSISEINGLIRKMLEGEFTHIWLRGEISNFKAHTSGHFYFCLKDDGAQINAVMFKGLNSKLKFKPDNGLEVIVKGKITVYEPRGNYQIFCESMEPIGAGALQKAFELLKAKLQAEGLFDSRRKRPIPPFPRHIGLVTSPTGAAIKDICNVLRRRYKGVRITLAPALVQGDPAPASIVSAIQLMNKMRDVDVMIVGRGGGSSEDLWAFNDERVARALAASRIPTISAVGHEIDFTIADFVADLRAPTPSAAAELVVKNALEVEDKIQSFKVRLWQAYSSCMRSLQEKVNSFSKRLVDPQRRMQDLQMRGDELATRLEAAMFRYFEDRRLNVQFLLKKLGTPRERLVRLQKRKELAHAALQNGMREKLKGERARLRETVGRLEAMSPLRVVARGYSIVERDEKIIKSAHEVTVGDQLDVKLAEGRLHVEVKKIIK